MMIKCKLGDLLEVKRGRNLSGEYYATEGERIRLTLGNFDYHNGGFKENTTKENIFFTGEVQSKDILKKGDIITPLTEQVAGLLGETARIPESNKYIQSGDVGLIIPNEKKLNKSFAYYLVASPQVKKQLGAAAQQTKIRHTSPEKIKECETWIPNLIYQEKAAHLLDSINSKIDINRKISEELEKMAKTLYNYWFLQYEFPNKEGKPYQSSGGEMVWNKTLKKEIPKRWEVKKCKDITDVITGREDANFATQNGKYKFFTCSQLDSVCDIPKFKGSAVIIAGNGDFNVKHYTGEFNAYQRNYVLIPNEIKYYSQLYIAATYKIESFQKGSNGSIVKFITKSDIEDINLLKPDNEELLSKLNEIILAAESAKQESEKLLELREFLLPLLMNEQVKF